MAADFLNQNTKKIHLQAKNTLFIGKVLLHHKELESTNQEAQTLLARGAVAEGTTVITDYQTAGRGQMGNKWTSAPGENIAMSIILHPKFLQVKQQFLLSQIIALAVRDCIADLIHQTTFVKWPNDIYVGEKKVAGILIQNSLAGKQIQHSILGVGINVNTPFFSNDLPKASSLSILSSKVFDLTTIPALIFEKLEHYYLQIRRGDHDHIRELYRQHLYRIDEVHSFTRPNGERLKARVVGVNEQGLLLLLHQYLETFNIKEIKFD